jgi:sphingolipid delta-4 desaturase
VDGLDTDLPTALEAVFFDSLAGKAFFCTFQILFYALRPVFVYKVPFTEIHFINIAIQVLFDLVLVKTCSVHSLYYLILSSFLAGSLHPCAGHFIAEHYVFDPPEAAKDPLTNTLIPETYSYYGPLNFFTYNVGLHNEHHDFPAVPWTRLRKLNAIAHEFYDDLPRHESWVGVIWRFILDDKVGMRCRVKRKEGGRKVGGWTEAEVQS